MELKKPQISRTLSTLMEDDATVMPGPHAVLWCWRALKSPTVMMTCSQVLLHAALQQVHMLCCDVDALSSPLLWWWRALKSSFTLLFNRSTCCAVMLTRSQVPYCDDDALSSPPSRCSSTGPHAVLWCWRALKSPTVMMTRSQVLLHAALQQVHMLCCDVDALSSPLLWWWRALKSSFTLLFNRSTCCAVMLTRSQVPYCDDDALSSPPSRCSSTGPHAVLWCWRALKSPTVMMTRSQVLLHAALQQVHMLCCDVDALSSPPSRCSSTGSNSMLMEELNWRFLPGLAPTSCSCPPPRTSASRRTRPPAPWKQPLTPQHSQGPPLPSLRLTGSLNSKNRRSLHRRQDTTVGRPLHRSIPVC